MPFLAREKIIGEDQVLDKEWLSKAIMTLQERAKTLIELADSLRYYISEDIEYNLKAKEKFLTENNLASLCEVSGSLKELDNFTAPEIEKIFLSVVEKLQTKLGSIAQPVRVAMTGKTESPGIFEVIEIVGKEKTLKRLEKAINTIKAAHD